MSNDTELIKRLKSVSDDEAIDYVIDDCYTAGKRIEELNKRVVELEPYESIAVAKELTRLQRELDRLNAVLDTIEEYAITSSHPHCLWISDYARKRGDV